MLARDWDVIAVDDLSGGEVGNVPQPAEFYEVDIRDDRTVGYLFEEAQPDAVVHCAAYAAEGLSHWIRRQNYEINLIGSANLINESVRHSVKRFVFTSSMAVYGSAEPPFGEAMTPFPEDPYGIAKAAVEADLRCAGDMWGLPWVVFRPHNVYGPRQNIADRYRNVVGIFMRQAMLNEPLTVYGDGEQTRAFSYIGDVAPVIADAVTAPCVGRIFNVGGDVPFTINELARGVLETIGRPLDMVKHLPTRYEVTNAFCAHYALREVFDVPRPTPLAEGLAEMAAWARARPMRASPWAPDYELTEKMPAVWRNIGE